jgi:hypothetical protein
VVAESVYRGILTISVARSSIPAVCIFLVSSNFFVVLSVPIFRTTTRDAMCGVLTNAGTEVYILICKTLIYVRQFLIN